MGSVVKWCLLGVSACLSQAATAIDLDVSKPRIDVSLGRTDFKFKDNYLNIQRSYNS